MLLMLTDKCNNQLIRHHQRPCRRETTADEMSLESRLEDDFYFDHDADHDDDEVDDAASPSSSIRSRHPHEDFEPLYDDYRQERPEGNEERRFPRKAHGKKKIFKPPFYADIAGFRPPQGVILNPKDSSFFPGLEPGGLAGITPKFIKFLRGHVKNVGKKKSIP